MESYYLIVATIVSIIVELIFSGIRKLISLRKDRERSINTSVPDMGQSFFSERNPPSIPPQPQSNVVDSPPIRMTDNVLPPLPVRSDGVVRRRPENVRRGPETFPSCPVCRCRNRTAQDRLVTWDADNRKWRCHNGHIFDS